LVLWRVMSWSCCVGIAWMGANDGPCSSFSMSAASCSLSLSPSCSSGFSLSPSLDVLPFASLARSSSCHACQYALDTIAQH
jgi:hypothetical protein